MLSKAPYYWVLHLVCFTVGAYLAQRWGAPDTGYHFDQFTLWYYPLSLSHPISRDELHQPTHHPSHIMATQTTGVSADSHCVSTAKPLASTSLKNVGLQHWNLATPALYSHMLQRGEGQLAEGGAIVSTTGKHTGRAAKDKYIVDEPSSTSRIGWGDVNKKLPEASYNGLREKAIKYLEGKEVFVMDVFAGAAKDSRMSVRVVTETARHALFVRTMFIRPTDEELENMDPGFTLIHVPGMSADPQEDGTESGTFIALNLGDHSAVIGGTFYAGEVKKTVFSAMNYYLPSKGILSLHSSANIGKEGDTALFFGLSGTGKTTLSADENRELIGDDEHGWSDQGTFNIEGGCYAKVIRLSQEAEPAIYATTQRFGTLIENVVMDPVTRQLDLDDGSITENTRAAYPIDFIPNYQKESQGGHPKNIVMLTCDAFGVLPPISKLTPEMAEYWFLLGYTAKVAGTEQGVTEPTATFSACFGLPFMPLNPTVYAKLLREKVAKHDVKVWLLNTGWIGGPYGIGKRISIRDTRALLNAALSGKLSEAEFNVHPVFKLPIPTEAPGVSSSILDPKEAWKNDEKYNQSALHLAGMFSAAFEQYAPLVSQEVLSCSPAATAIKHVDM